MNIIRIGDIIPPFTLKDQNGNDFDISSFLGRKKQTETQRHADEALKICLLLKRTDNVNI
jgi:hypothetical protein